MTRAPWLIVVALLAGCATVVPMQTASAIDRGGVRLGGQLAFSGYCGSVAGGGLGITSCTEYPDGLQLPELRVNGRYGLGHGFDLGASVQALTQLSAPERAFQLGLTVELKGEVLRIATRGPTHIVSLGLLGGASVAGRFGLPAWTASEWGVPLLYGLQFQRWELVLGASASLRNTHSPGLSPSTDSVRTGFTLGLFHRAPAGLALQLGYLTDPARFGSGTIQLQVGMFFDVR